MAGGITEKGSFRQVDLIRDNKLIDSIDLYDTFVNGESVFGSRLKTGDSILVKPVKTLISISGAINRPNEYELVAGETYKDLLVYANGFSPRADRSYIRIERLKSDDVSYLRVLEDELASMIPLPGDSIYVKAFNYRSVTITGAVNTPGKYVISENETLSTLIKKAEGYKDNAYPFGGALINLKTLAINSEAVEKLYQSFIKNLVINGSALISSESLPLVLSQLKSTNISGRVMADFDLDLIAARPSLDTSLEDGDSIIIPTIMQQVYIYGEINNPGTIRYQPNKSIKSYLSSSGGVLESGDVKNIFVVHPNGEVNVLNSKKLSFLNTSNEDILVYPGTVIYIPRKLLTKDSAVIASIWAPIVSALALSLTSLSVLDN